MANMDQVLDLLRRSDHSFRRTRGAHRRLLIALLLVIGPIYLGALIFTVFGLANAWQGGGWLESFSLQVLPAAPVAINSARLFLADDERRVLFAPVSALREAIRQSDEQSDEALAPKSETAVSTTPSQQHLLCLIQPVVYVLAHSAARKARLAPST